MILFWFIFNRSYLRNSSSFLCFKPLVSNSVTFQMSEDIESKLLLSVGSYFAHTNGPVSASRVQNRDLKLKIFSLRN